MCHLLRGLPRRSPLNRRNTKKPPRASPLRMVIESLETRAMLAGVEPESWSAPGLAPAPLGTGALLSSGVILTCSSPTPGSSGTSSPPAPAAGSGGSQSTGLVLPSNSGSGTGSSSTGSGSSSSGGLALPSNSGSGTGSSSTGSGSSNSGGLALPSNSGSAAGSSHSGTGSTSDPNSPVLSSQYTGGPNAGGKGTGTNNSGTLSGSDLWLLYGARLGAATSSSGTIGSSSSNFSALLSLYKDGASAGGQGDEAGGALSNADLWIFYGSGAGAGSSSGSTNGSLANDPALSAQYTDGSGIGPNTPLVYNPQSDGPPVFVTGVLTGNGGNVQFVPVADSTGGQDGGDPPAGRPTWNDAEPYYDGGPRWVFEFEAGVGRYDPRKTGPKPADSDTTADAPRDQSAGATPNADGITRTEERPVAIAETKQFLINTTIDLALALAFSKFFNTGKGGRIRTTHWLTRTSPKRPTEKPLAIRQSSGERASQARI